MSADYLDRLRARFGSFCSFDFETCLIQPGLQFPPAVCLTWESTDGTRGLVDSSDREALVAKLRYVFSHEYVGTFNGPFDLGVSLSDFPELAPLLFAKCDAYRVLDVMVAQTLGEVATGRSMSYMSMERSAAFYGVATLDKENAPRLDYARFLGRSVSEYPPAHVDYAVTDAVVTNKLTDRVFERFDHVINSKAVASETRNQLWLTLCAGWGLRTDPEALSKLDLSAHEHVERLRETAEEWGFVRSEDHMADPELVAAQSRKAGKIGAKDTQALKSRVRDAYEGHPPLTKKGLEVKREGGDWQQLKYVATNKIALADSGDVVLEQFAEYGEWSAVLNKDLDMLSDGISFPIHTTYRMAATTRVTSANPNTTNFRRLAGVRECVVPRAGNCLGFIDVTGLELGTLAQAIYWTIGDREMLDMLNDGTDLHCFTASKLLQEPYETVYAKRKEGKYKKARDSCKGGNFGFAGGMSPKTFVSYARGMGVRVTLKESEAVKKAWQKALPSVSRFHKYVKKCKSRRHRGRFDFIIPGSPGILRANATFCSAANGHFQGLGAQAMKLAGYRIMKESWLDETSPLYGVPMVLFIHDEFGFEIPIGKQDAVLRRADEIIVQALADVMPDVKMTTEFVACSRWAKSARELYDEQGKLMIDEIAA